MSRRQLERRTLLAGTGLGVLGLGLGCTRRANPAKLPGKLFDAAPPASVPLSSTAAAETALARLRECAPETFKMVHQVSAHYGPKRYGMTGYLLGRKDGNFRISAAASLGPRLFDVAKIDGRWEAKVHLAQIAEQLDPRHVGRAVERIYFTDAVPTPGSPTVPLVLKDPLWVQRAPLEGDDELDEIEVRRDGATLAVVGKRFFKDSKLAVEVDYRELNPDSGVARKVRLKDARGFELYLYVAQYAPGFPVPPERLHVA